jgi:Ca-activated chloride channel family protein
MKLARSRIAGSVMAASLLASSAALTLGQEPVPIPPSRTIRVDVDVVIVSVTVTDERNRFVQGLNREHFRVWEDRIEQEIVQFGSEDTPVSLGIVLDRSGSMGGQRGRSPLDLARESAYSCLKNGLREDEYFLIEFSDTPQVSADFTTDVADLSKRLFFSAAGGRTALWDAIYAGVAKLQDAAHARKALLVLTDGGENRSRYSLGELKGALREKDVRIYGADRVEVEIDGLAQLAEQTGGRIFRSSNPCEELAADLRSQYVIGYRSTNRAADGAWRAIRVRLDTDGLPRGMSDLSVRARTGYYARSESEAK